MMAEKSDRTKKIEASQVDPDEDFMTRGVRGAMRGIALGASKAGDFVKQGVEDQKRGFQSTVDALSRALGTERGKQLDKELGFRDASGNEKTLPSTTPAQRAEIRNMQYTRKKLQGQDEGEAELRRESRGMKKGGKVKMSSASKRADGIAARGKTRGRMV
jgi:hypothetical protein